MLYTDYLYSCANLIMISEIRQHCILTISDFSIIRSKNIENVITGILIKKFKGICYKKTYILDIVKILKMSDFEFNQNDINNCSFNLEVLFLCKCEIIMPEEPVCDMKVLNIKPNSITLGSENKIAIVKDFNQTDISTFKVGDIMPVCAIKCIYEPRSNKIKMGCSIIKKMYNFEDTPSLWINTKSNNFGHLYGIISYSEQSKEKIVEDELKKRNSNLLSRVKGLISYNEFLDKITNEECKEWIKFKTYGFYGDNVKIEQETDDLSKDDLPEVDDGYLYGLICNQYIVRNSLKTFKTLLEQDERNKNILQKYYNMYYNK